MPPPEKSTQPENIDEIATMTTAACGAEIEDIQLCTCGQSASHPFCDKSHQLVNAGTGLNYAPVPLSELKKQDALSTHDLLVIHAAARRRASSGCRPKLSDALSHQQVLRETRRQEIENLSKAGDVDEQVLCQDPHCDRQSSTSSNNSAVAVAFPEDFPTTTTTTTTTTTATTSSPPRSRHHRHHRHRHQHANENESAAAAAVAPSSDIEDTVEDPQVARQRSANNDQQVTPVFSWRRMRKRDLLNVTQRELAQHVTRESCWVAVGSNVYDVTEFLDKHKSGAGTILKHAGTDITHHVQFHSSAMMKLLKKHYLIGKLVADPSDEDDKQSTCAIV